MSSDLDPRPVTQLTILAGIVVNGPDGHHLYVKRAPATYEGPVHIPMPVPSNLGDRVILTLAITPPDPEGPRRRIIDMRGAPSRPGPA